MHCYIITFYLLHDLPPVTNTALHNPIIRNMAFDTHIHTYIRYFLAEVLLCGKKLNSAVESTSTFSK